MPGLTSFVNWIHAGIVCSNIPIFLQNSTGNTASLPLPDSTGDGDITMGDIPHGPPFGEGSDPWNQLSAQAPNLVDRHPSNLTFHEDALRQMLHHGYGLSQEEGRISKPPKACGSIVIIDEIMGSPPPNEPEPHLPQSSPEVIGGASLDDSCNSSYPPEVGDSEAASSFTAFTNVRRHPYYRSDIKYQLPSDEVPKWVKKKASTRTFDYREASRGQEPALKAEVLAQAKIHVEEAGGVWDEYLFLRQHGSQLDEIVQEIIEKENATASRDTNDEYYFSQAVQYIRACFQQQMDDLAGNGQTLQAKVQVVQDLDDAIDDLRAGLKKLMKERRKYPRDKKTLYDELQANTFTKGQVTKRCDQLIAALRSTMSQPGQDFFSAWRTFQVRFDLPPHAWPSGVPTTDHYTSSPSHHAYPTLDADPDIPSSSVPKPRWTSTGSSAPPSNSSPPSSISRPPASSSSAHSEKYLPIRKPRTLNQCFERYTEAWTLLKSDEVADGLATFEQMPWPVLFDLKRNDLKRNDKGEVVSNTLTVESIRTFLLHPSRPEAQAPERNVFRSELLRWHSDKLNNALFHKFIPEDRSDIREVAKLVYACISELYERLRSKEQFPTS